MVDNIEPNMIPIPPAKTVRNSLSGILAMSESIVDSSIDEAAADATCDDAVVGIEVVSACISSIEGRYRCNEDDVVDVIRYLGVVNDVT
jgi:copper chaperone CopZ